MKYGRARRSRDQAPSGSRLCKAQPASLQGPQCLYAYWPGHRKGLHPQLLTQQRLLLACLMVVNDQFSWPQSFQNAGWTTIPLLTHTLLSTHILALPTSPSSYHTVNKEASLIPIHHAQPVVLDKQTVSTTSLELDADYIQKSYPKSCPGKASTYVPGPTALCQLLFLSRDSSLSLPA